MASSSFTSKASLSLVTTYRCLAWSAMALAYKRWLGSLSMTMRGDASRGAAGGEAALRAPRALAFAKAHRRLPSATSLS